MNYFEFVEDDLARIYQLNWDSPDVLNGVCKAIGAYLTTLQYTQKVDCWSVTPKGSHETFTGSFKEVSSFVRGYATAWHYQRWLQRAMLRSLTTDINNKINEL